MADKGSSVVGRDLLSSGDEPATTRSSPPDGASSPPPNNSNDEAIEYTNIARSGCGGIFPARRRIQPPPPTIATDAETNESANTTLLQAQTKITKIPPQPLRAMLVYSMASSLRYPHWNRSTIRRMKSLLPPRRSTKLAATPTKITRCSSNYCNRSAPRYLPRYTNALTTSYPPTAPFKI